MEGFFNSRRNIALVLCLLCLAVLGAALLTDGLPGKYPASGYTGYNAAALYKYKTAYVGDNSKVVNLINNLPYAEMRGEISLQTESPPYGVTVEYDFSYADFDTRPVGSDLRDNAVVLFALIDNVDVIAFNVRGAGEPSKHLYTRAEVQANCGRDLREYSKDIDALKALLNSIAFKLHTHPEKYALVMSHTPGIRIAAEYRGKAAKARYATENGLLLTWDISTGEVSKGMSSIELTLGTPVYWSPLGPDGHIFGDGTNPVTVTLLDGQGKSIDEKQLLIDYDGSSYYTVQPSVGIVIGEKTL
ncbi:DUF4825 domain-containing protein [Pelotomaculum propionicicum]